MPIELGDAVLRFLGDASQLDMAFDNIQASAEGKLKPAAASAQAVGKELNNAGEQGKKAGADISEAWLKVARATQENQVAQKALSEALASVKKNASSDAMNQLALAQEKAARSALDLTEATKAATAAGERESSGMRERRESMAAIGELTTVTIPRGLRTWIAEMPQVGAAMEMAFSALAPLLLVSVLSEGVNKLIEWHEKAEKLREAWTKNDTEFRITSHGIKEEIDSQQEKFIQLTEGPIAAYEFALKHIKSTFDESVGKIAGELDKQGQSLEARGSWFKAIFGGEETANAKAAGKDLQEFSALLQETMHKAQDASKDNPMAGMEAGLDAVSEKIKEVDKQIEEQKAVIDSANADQLTMGLDAASLERMKTALQMVQQLMEQSRAKEEASRKAQETQIEKDKIAHEVGIETAKLDVQQQFGLVSLALAAERHKVEFARGRETLDQQLQAEKDNENQRYALESSSLDQKLELLKRDPTRNEQAIIAMNGKIQDAEKQHQLSLLKLDEESYQRHADRAVKAFEITISKTKEGTQARVDSETALLAFLKATWGEQSDAYLSQQQRVNAATLAFNSLKKTLAKEDAHFEEQTVQQKTAADLAYYQFLRTTAQISAAQLLSIQQQASDKLYQSKREALTKELAQLEPEQLLAIKRVNDQIALLDTEYQNKKRLMYAETANIIDASYQQLGLKSTMATMRERDQSIEAYKAIAASGTASYGQLLEAKMKVLQATIALNAAEGKNVQADQAALDKLTATYHKLGLAMGTVNSQSKLGATLFKSLGVDANLMGSVMSNVAVGSTAALGKMFQSWEQGGVTVGQACAQITAAILQSLAQYSFAKATEQLALGFAAMSPTSPDFGHSGDHFASAALWFAAGAATSVVGGLVSGASSGGSGSSASSPAASSAITGSGASSTPVPINAVNVQHFAGGGLISKRTLAVIGDSAGGGDADEAALPLNDRNAMDTIGRAIGPHVQGGGGDIHIHVQGLISPDNLTKVMSQMSKKVKKNQGALTSSNSFKTTKRS